MSIVRTEHNKENPYVMLNKHVLEDKNLSWTAKGLWSYLMSRPNDWTVSVAHLSTIYEDKGGGEKAIYTLLNELIAKGYCTRKQTTGEKGQFGKYDYTITEFKNKVPHSPQADAAQPHAAEGATTNKGNILSKKTTTKRPPADDDPSSFEEKKPRDNQTPEIKLSDEQREELNNFTPEQISQAQEITAKSCVQKSNPARTKFFFKVLENLMTQKKKKPELSPYDILSKQFRSDGIYGRGRHCIITRKGISFSSTLGYDYVMFNFDKFWSWKKFKDYCQDFAIPLDFSQIA